MHPMVMSSNSKEDSEVPSLRRLLEAVVSSNNPKQHSEVPSSRRLLEAVVSSNPKQHSDVQRMLY